MKQVEALVNTEKWKGLYKIAGYAAIVMLVIIPIQIAVFFMTPIPDSIEAWFSLFHSNRLLGLIHQDMLYIINNILVAVMYLAFYCSLRRENESLMAVALLLGLLGISAYLASNKSFEMLNISSQYFAAAADAEKSVLLAAGQGLLASWQGTAFLVYYVLNGITLILISYVMMKSAVFTRKTAIIGLVSGVLMMIPSTVGTIGLVFSLASLIPWYAFSILCAKQFLHMSK